MTSGDGPAHITCRMTENSAYEQQTFAPRRRRSEYPRAVVLFLEGRLHFATQASLAEHELLARGAVPVGFLRFDAIPSSLQLRQVVPYRSGPVEQGKRTASPRFEPARVLRGHT
jgi:hypothetical protein